MTSKQWEKQNLKAIVKFVERSHHHINKILKIPELERSQLLHLDV